MRVGELVDKMLAGDRAAGKEVRRRLAADDDAMAAEIGRRLVAGEKLGRLLVEPQLVETQSAEDQFQADLLRAKDLTTSNPATTGGLMEALGQRARLLGRCQVVQVLGMEARRLTLVGDVASARAALDQARQARQEGDCRACDLEALRREALLLLHLGEPERALRLSQGAMDGYEALGGPGHDLNGNGWASSLIARAQIRSALGDKTGSAADFALALEHFHRGTKVWRVTHQNLAGTLALLGPLEQRQARKMMTPLRLSLRRERSVDWAASLGLAGLLLITAGDERRSRRSDGLDLLKSSLDLYGLPTIGTPGPWLGVGSDIARVLYPDGRAIARFLERKVEPHVGRLIKADVHRQQLGDLRALCESRYAAPPALRRAIESLREAAAGAMPCLLPAWRP